MVQAFRDPIGGLTEGFLGGFQIAGQVKERKQREQEQAFKIDLTAASLSMQIFGNEKNPSKTRLGAYQNVGNFIQKYASDRFKFPELDEEDLKDNNIKEMVKGAAEIFKQLDDPKNPLKPEDALNRLDDLVAGAEGANALAYLKGKTQRLEERIKVESKEEERPFKIGQLVDISRGGQDLKVPVTGYNEQGVPIFGEPVSERPTFKPGEEDGEIRGGVAKSTYDSSVKEIAAIIKRSGTVFDEKMQLLVSNLDDFRNKIADDPTILEAVKDRIKDTPEGSRLEFHIGVTDKFHGIDITKKAAPTTTEIKGRKSLGNIFGTE